MWKPTHLNYGKGNRLGISRWSISNNVRFVKHFKNDEFPVHVCDVFSVALARKRTGKKHYAGFAIPGNELVCM